MERNPYDAGVNEQNGETVNENVNETASENAQSTENQSNQSSQSGAQYNEYSYNPNQQQNGSAYFQSGDPYAQYAYRGYGAPPNNPYYPPKKSGKAGYVIVLCICVVISLVVGSFAGAVASFSFDDQNVDKAPPTADKVVSQTTVTVNKAEVDHGAVVNATEVAYNSAVTINVYVDKESANEDQSVGAGSGVIYSYNPSENKDEPKDNYILTCNHVVEGYDIIRVTLANGNYYYAEIVGTDPQTDLAVLKVSDQDLPACVIRDWETSPLTIGETVIAIGNPLGVLGHSVTSGIISGLARNITVEGQSMTLLQTDASINSGNSGGGLFDINGSLIGIVNAKSTGSTIDNLGFAIPIDTADFIAKELIEHGYVTGRPGLNVSIVTVTTSNYASVLQNYPELEEYVVKSYQRYPWGGGQQIKDIYTGIFIVDASKVQYPEGSDEALKFGDRIVQIENPDGTVIDNIQEAQTLSNIIQELQIGDQLTITVYRDGKYVEVPALLVEKAG